MYQKICIGTLVEKCLKYIKKIIIKNMRCHGWKLDNDGINI